MAKSVVTKLGDKGETYLYCGSKVSKDDVRVEACGVLDELSSWLGLVRASFKSKKEKNIIQATQKDLFIIGAEISTKNDNYKKYKVKINNDNILYLKEQIDILEKNSNKINCFCLVGQNKISSYLDIARTIARRVERRVTTLNKKKLLKNKYILIYLNRLSDFLYLLARSKEKNIKAFKLK